MNIDILKPCEHCNGTGKRYSDQQGAQLRHERKAAKLTLEVVAKRMGVSTAYVSDLETGKRALNHGLVERFRGAIKQTNE